MPYLPRLAIGAYSALSNADPAHSPPTAKPWSKRRASSSSGAATPMVAAPGTRPTPTVDRPMISNVAIRVCLRPSRSPKCPKTAAPTGRETKATPNVAKDAMVATVGDWWGKKTCGNTNAAAVP